MLPLSASYLSSLDVITYLCTAGWVSLRYLGFPVQPEAETSMQGELVIQAGWFSY